MKSVFAAVAVMFAVLNASTAVAADEPHSPASTAATRVPMTSGEVRRVDRAAKKITLRHEEMKSLDMPPMTMVLQVADPAMLDKVKAGDKVKFTAANINGAFTLTEIEAEK